MRHTLLTALGILILMNPTQGQEAPDTSGGDTLPLQEISEVLRAHQVPPIPAPAEEALVKHYDERWMKWCERVLIAPLAERIPGDAALKKRALKSARDGFTLLRRLPVGDYCQTELIDPMELVTELEALEAAGVHDPLLKWFRGWAYFRGTRDFLSAKAVLDKAVDNSKLINARPVERYMMILHRTQAYREARYTKQREPNEDIFQYALATLKDGTYLPEEQDILLENLDPVFKVDLLNGDVDRGRLLTEQPEQSEWCRKMLRGKWEQGKAWLAQTTWSTSAPPPPGWRGYRGESAAAYEQYAEAWKLDPKRPEAAYGILSLTKDAPADSIANRQEWFDNAIKLRFDDMETWHIMFKEYRRKPVEGMMAWGFAAAHTGRFDTEVPYFFFEALNLLATRAKGDAKARTYCKDPLVRKVAVALSRRRLQDAKTPEQKKDAQHLLGAYAWLCGDYETAAEAFKAEPQLFRRNIRVFLLPLLNDEIVMRGESIIMADGHQEKWEMANKHVTSSELEEALRLYEELAKSAKGDAAALVNARMETVRLELTLHTDQWTPIEAKPGLDGWKISKGKWEGTPDGTLKLAGNGESAWILHESRVGTEFQIRGVYEVTNASNGEGIGIMVGYKNFGRNEFWITCTHNKQDRGGSVGLMNGMFASSAGWKAVGDPVSRASFLITCQNGLLTYAINGREIFRQAQIWDSYSPSGNPVRLMKDGQIGFGHRGLNSKVTYSISNIEVRRIPKDFNPAEDLAAEAGPGAEIRTEGHVVEAKDIRTSDDLFDYLDGSTWEFSKQKDGASMATITMHSRYRNFFFYKSDEPGQNHTMSAIDHQSISIGGDKTLTFYEDYTKFELKGWPYKGDTRWGKLKKLPSMKLSLAELPKDLKPERSIFADTEWQSGEFRLLFAPDGTYKTIKSDKIVEGTWHLQSATEILGARDDIGLRHYELSVDGTVLIRLEDGTTWKKVEK